MTVPFGFSAGDFVAITSLVWQICQALREASGDAKIFGNLLTELVAFNDVVVGLQASTGTLLSVPQDQHSILQETLQQARATIEDFSRYIDAFRASSANGAKTQSIASWRKRVSWSLSGVKKIKGFRESMQSYSAILSLALLSLNTHAVQKLDQRVGEEAKSLRLQMQQDAVDMSLQISSSLEDPWDQKPIRFQDAMGRRYPVPLEVCRTLVGLLDFFNHAFKDTPMDTAIEQFSIWLFTPVLGKAKHWNLITAEDWETCARPGMRLGMSLATTSIDDGSGPKGTFSFKTQAQIGFHTPLPSWAPYPEDAQFDYLPSKKVPSLVQFPPLAKADRLPVTSTTPLHLACCCREFELFTPAITRAISGQPKHPKDSTRASTSLKSFTQLKSEPDFAPAPQPKSESLHRPEHRLKQEANTLQQLSCIYCGTFAVCCVPAQTPICDNCRRRRGRRRRGTVFPPQTSTSNPVKAADSSTNE